ncbi:MAG: hypothetical protein MZU97_05710 [Bacillus subtilis]|nr:hypothetical protein [Bacillus subtilis]
MTLVVSGVGMTVALIVFFANRQYHSRRTAWFSVLVVPFLAGLAAATIWLDPESTIRWTFDIERVLAFLVIVLLWSTLLRLLPWKKTIAWLSVVDLVVAIGVGILWIPSRPFALEMLLLAVFYLPVAIGIVVFASSKHTLDKIIPLSLFGAFLLIYVIALIVATDGEGAGVLEVLGDVEGNKRPKAKRSKAKPLD